MSIPYVIMSIPFWYGNGDGSHYIQRKSYEIGTGAETFKGNHKKSARELRHSKKMETPMRQYTGTRLRWLAEAPLPLAPTLRR